MHFTKTTFRIGSVALALSALLATSAMAMDVPKKTTTPAAPAPAAAATPAAPAAATDPAAPPASTDLGVFSAAQVERGKAAYATNCSICHGARLQGSPGGPGLAGTDFKATFIGAPVGAIFDFAKAMMPPGRAGSLSDQKYVDIVAYVLARNGYPAGQTDLPADSDFLGAIQITEPPAK